MSPINAIEKRLPWSFFGFLLGTISLGIALWFFYLSKQEGVTNLKFYVEDEFPLVELKEQFPDMKVLYNEEDILKSEKEIKIIRLRLANDGQTILQSYFDQQLPFGLTFQKSAILAIAPVSASGGYLQDNLFRDGSKEEFQAGKLLLNKPIIEKGSQVPFKVYLLQEKGIRATNIKALGKISGMEEIRVVPFDPDQKTPGKPERSTGEIIAIGVASGYFGVLALVLTLLPITTYVDYRGKRTREKHCEEFLNENVSLTGEQKELIASYARGWHRYHLPTIRTLAHGGEALDISDLLLRQVRERRLPFPLEPFFSYARIERLLPLRWDPSVFTVTDGKISLNANNRDMLLKFLQKCGEIEQADADDG